MKAQSEISDSTIVDFLRRRESATIGELVEHTGVTATAVRQRLTRLMAKGMIERNAEVAGRGRPMHRYSLTELGRRSGGNNYDQLAQVLWEEIRDVRDPEIRRGLLKRISERLAATYRDQLHGKSLQERMSELAGLMSGHDVPFVVEQSGTELPVLTALACPYPDLAEQDRGICAMEKMLLSEALGEGVRLSACRLDGANCCTFEMSAAGAG